MVFLSTMDTPPPGYEIEASMGLVEVTYPIEVSSKGLIRGLLERKRNEHQEAVNALERSIPTGANAVMGIKATSAVQSFDQGTFLYLTYIGTAVRLVEMA